MKILSSSEEMNEFQFFIRAVLVGIYLGIFGKFIPRRGAGGLSAFDFTFFWMMGGLIASPLFDSKITFKDTVIAAITMLIIHKVIAILATKNRLFDKIVKGKPAGIIINGQVQERVMRRNLINNEILFSELRKNSIFNLSQVQHAYYENNGHLTVLNYPEYQSVTKTDLEVPASENVIPQLIISDGKVDTKSLIKTDLNSVSLNKVLDNNYKIKIKDVFIAYWEGTKKLIIKRKLK